MLNRQQFHFRLLIFILFQLALIRVTDGQSVLTDVTAAFKAISATPQLLHLKNGGFKIPAGGHLQGIQSLNNRDIVITASSDSYSYYMVGQLNQRTGKGKITSVQKIADSPYRHAGGCQVNTDTMVVGIEDNRARDKSQIVMVSFDDSSKQNDSHVIAHREGFVKRSTAGAVGFTKDNSGHYLVAVGDWDSRNIDFYLSKSWSILLFDSLTTFSAAIGQKWPSYQSINLLADANGKIYLIGFALDGVNNRADLFEVSLQKEAAYLRLISTRNFKCKGGAGFRYGSGICVTRDKKLAIYTCGRNVTGHTPINIFR